MSPRVPRLECSYDSICKLQPLYFVIGRFWRGLRHEGWELCKAHLCEVPKRKKEEKRKEKTFLTTKMIFDRALALETSILNIASEDQSRASPPHCI